MKCTLCNREIDGDIRREDTLIFEELYPKQSMELFKDTHVCRSCADKERTRVKVDKYKSFVEAVFQKVNRNNVTQSDLDALVLLLNHEHRYLQNEFISWVKGFLFAYGEGSDNPAYEDARNAWALAWSKAAACIEVTLDQATGKYKAEFRQDRFNYKM